MPRVSIALPCYNGELYLAEALQDLKNQTHRDFEVVVYDNASTDATHAIAQRFADADSRFRIIRRPQTVPLFDNFRLTLADVDSEFLMWRADDDLSAPNYVETLLALLQANPQAALAGSQIRTHKLHKNRIKVRRAPSVPAGRLAGALALVHWSHPSWIYGLFRRQHLQRSYEQALKTLPHTWAVDHATLFPMLVSGQAVVTNDTYFIQRMGGDPGKSKMAALPSAQQWAIFQAFRLYCAARVDETDFDAVSKAVLKASLWRYASKRTFRLGRMLGSRLRGA